MHAIFDKNNFKIDLTWIKKKMAEKPVFAK